MAGDIAFNALADPVRREILSVLADCGECSAGELADRIERVGRTAVSNHLRILRLADLVAESRRGRFRFYSINLAGPAQEVIELLQDVFQTSLNDVQVAAEAAAEIPADGETVAEAG